MLSNDTIEGIWNLLSNDTIEGIWNMLMAQ